MRPLPFKGQEWRQPGHRTLLQHTPEEAERIADFINDIVHSWNDPRTAAAVASCGGVWFKPRLRLREGEPLVVAMMRVLADEWFYSNVECEYHIVPGCTPVLTVSLK